MKTNVETQTQNCNVTDEYDFDALDFDELLIRTKAAPDGPFCVQYGSYDFTMLRCTGYCDLEALPQLLDGIEFYDHVMIHNGLLRYQRLFFENDGTVVLHTPSFDENGNMTEHITKMDSIDEFVEVMLPVAEAME